MKTIQPSCEVSTHEESAFVHKGSSILHKPKKAVDKKMNEFIKDLKKLGSNLEVPEKTIEKAIWILHIVEMNESKIKWRMLQIASIFQAACKLTQV